MRPPARHAQAAPLFGLQMLGQKDNLSAVIRIMSQLPVDRLHHRVRFSADRHPPLQIGIRQWLQRAEYHAPTGLPKLHQRLAPLWRKLEFGVPEPLTDADLER